VLNVVVLLKVPLNLIPSFVLLLFGSLCEIISWKLFQLLVRRLAYT
jgi:energy-converting hydrogenase Eha subunit C